MTTPTSPGHPDAGSIDAARELIYPIHFSPVSIATSRILREPATRKVVEFFEDKGLAALKREDQCGQFYDDWLKYQGKHRIYASMLSPKAYSQLGTEFDVLRYARFLEVFAYFSPSHGYSIQVTFLGLFSILMGSNSDLKREAVSVLEKGGLLGLGVSEQNHGSDLLANEFAVREIAPSRFTATGTKYYIGNSNVAAMISILGRKVDAASSGRRIRRAPPVLFVLRPGESKGFRNTRKIPTLGVRMAYVGEFNVQNHEFPASDIIAEARDAWDAVLGTVTLGKFFLGFGSIGICEHAFHEAADHLRARMLYGNPVMAMPHISAAMTQAYTRLTAMKLYAYRALDYVHAACAQDRRYLLFCAVQKAKVSTEGVQVMSLLGECLGAKGFEADTYVEMALRDSQLIPGLEGSTHINLLHAAQFIPRYFGRFDPRLAIPLSLVGGEVVAAENPYLVEARSNAINTIAFPSFLRAYRPFRHIPNVRLFAEQARGFRTVLRSARLPAPGSADTQISLALGKCLATMTYGQLVAENAQRLNIGPEMISAIFHLLVQDLSVSVLSLASLSQFDTVSRNLLSRLAVVPQTTGRDWEAVSARMNGK